MPKISLPGITAQGPKDNGSPVTVGKSDSGVSLILPAGSKVVKREIKGLGYRPATKDQPAQKETSDETVTEFYPSGPSEYHETKQDVKASSGTVDTTVRQHQIDVEERRWLLWAAIGCCIGGVLLRSFMPAWPGLSNGLLLGAALAFGAWKLSEIPSWIWMVAIAIMGAKALGYQRALWDKDGDGIPDFLQKPKPPSA